tara:strand:+ start:256 stop:885 length:630 start_codon:yes stop_codon:yes gene_type:complete
MSKFIIALLSLFSFQLYASIWGTDYESIVRDGVFNDYKQSTVGVAFDGWSQCDVATDWEHYEEDNGRNMVKFTCTSREAKKEHALALRSTIMDAFPNKEKADEYASNVCAADIIQGYSNCNFTWEKYFSSLQTPFKIGFFFQVNIDESFELIGVNASQGSFNVDLAGVGSVDDFISLVMRDNILPQNVIDIIHSEFGKYVALEELKNLL